MGHPGGPASQTPCQGRQSCDLHLTAYSQWARDMVVSGQSAGGFPARRGEGSGPWEGPLGPPAGPQQVKVRGYNSCLPCSSRAGLSFVRKGYFRGLSLGYTLVFITC